MARMLGRSIGRGYCWCRDCQPPHTWQVAMRRVARAREKRRWRRENEDGQTG